MDCIGPRYDADFVASMGIEHASSLVECLGEEFFVSERSIVEAVQRRRCFNAIHLETMHKIDVFVMKSDAFARSQMARRKKLSLATSSNDEVFFCSPEDTVLAKMKWYSDTGNVSDRQWSDIVGVLKVQGGRLDLDYLFHWSKVLDLSDLLLRALADAGLSSPNS